MIKKALLTLSALSLFLLPQVAQSDTTQDTTIRYKQNYKQEQKQSKQHKPFSIEVGTKFLSYAPPDHLHKTVENLYNNLKFEIKKWPSSFYPFIKVQYSPIKNLSLEADLGFLVVEDLTASGVVNTIFGSDTLYKEEIYVNTTFNESSVGMNIKYYLNTESGRIYFGLGAAKISEKLNIKVKLDMYDGEDGNLLAYYDGTHNYYGETYQINTLFGVEIPLLKGLNLDFFINYTIEGKCNLNLVSKIEKAQGIGANLSEERIDEKKGTSYVGLGIKYDLPIGF
jgi:hypothetical protein